MTCVDKSARLRELLAGDRLACAVGAGDGLSAMLGERHGFDAVWASGLSISAFYGMPDASIVTMSEFLDVARLIDRATCLPVLADCDTGFGDLNVVMRAVRDYERAGIAGICIEDQQFPKRNSFSAGPELLPVEEFAAKLRAAKAAQASPAFVVVARIESFIVGLGLEDALQRALRYRDAGADAILIHSKAKTDDEVSAFAGAWREIGSPLPLLALPTTYYRTPRETLHMEGFSMLIYANQGVRAAMRAIDEAFRWIRDSPNTEGLESRIASVRELLAFIGMDDVGEIERRFAQPAEEEDHKPVFPAAGASWTGG